MIKGIQNLRIGAKLGIASALGVIFVALMIINQLTTNASVSRTNESVLLQSNIARAAIDAKAAARGLQVGAANIRVATIDEELQKATEYLAARYKGFLGFIDEISRLSTADTRSRLEKLKSTATAYESAAEKLAKMKTELLEIASVEASGLTISSEAQARAAQLTTDSRQIANDVMLPLSAELESNANTIVDRAKQVMAGEIEKAAQQAASADRMSLAIGGVAALLLIVTSVLSALSIAGPMRSLSRAMQELANGNFDVQLPGIGRKDEIGAVAQAVETFKVKAEEKAMLESESKRRQDDLLAGQRRAEMIKLADAFEGAVGEIVSTVSSASTELEQSAKALTSTAERAQEITVAVASASEEASANVQSVATATEQLSSSVNEISRQVQDSARIAADAVGQARATTERVSELSKAASRIGDVVELINTIAGQTNLLALNATIEAARAGDAGRGFAVVASEVKALAEQTAKATGEIGQQIAAIQTATDQSVGAIGQISNTIESLAEIASTVAAAVEEQGAATQEIARNVQQAAQGTEEVSSRITDVQRGATATGSASSQVLSSAQSLSRDSSRLQTEVSRFLQTVRAA
ncbi:HAMP domain-containing methyl-accepting chemotaxis protein [Bradyrhizobium sp. Leo121]|uniref:methyl-accepting chemotaxis protein n=1 Tax=Bradyrhizobium sp. Leo121 TaxID=1571195 RepID=UPI00102A2AFD|nr:HAMP domain-containing methyl-accepting chemotaxis protein [Bradyrhizobium sp. Leo121]RZN32517.1 methyl-accepting chemotaxis protein [Bradyrhizobium sp. Leo121]